MRTIILLALCAYLCHCSNFEETEITVVKMDPSAQTNQTDDGKIVTYADVRKIMPAYDPKDIGKIVPYDGNPSDENSKYGLSPRSVSDDTSFYYSPNFSIEKVETENKKRGCCCCVPMEDDEVGNIRSYFTAKRCGKGCRKVLKMGAGIVLSPVIALYMFPDPTCFVVWLIFLLGVNPIECAKDGNVQLCKDLNTTRDVFLAAWIVALVYRILKCLNRKVNKKVDKFNETPSDKFNRQMQRVQKNRFSNY